MRKAGFSWKRATGISKTKSKIARATGIPNTKAGRKRKARRIATSGCMMPFIVINLILTGFLLISLTGCISENNTKSTSIENSIAEAVSTVTQTPMPSQVLTQTPEPTVIPEQTPQVTETPVPTETLAATTQPTTTPIPTQSPVPTQIPTPTPSQIIVITPTPGPIYTQTPMPVPSSTPVPTPEPIPVPTITPVPVPIPTPEPTPTPIPVATQTPDTEGVKIIELDKEAEYIVIKNQTPSPVDMTGWWILSVLGEQDFDFPKGYVLAAGQECKVAGFKAKDTGDFNWEEGRGIWNNSKTDDAALYNGSELVDYWED